MQNRSTAFSVGKGTLNAS